jgi:hypothetical protein
LKFYKNVGFGLLILWYYFSSLNLILRKTPFNFRNVVMHDLGEARLSLTNKDNLEITYNDHLFQKFPF